MSAIAEVTKLAASIVANLPIIKGINTAQEHEQALALMDALLEDYDANLVVIEALSNVIARYEDQSKEFEEFNNRQAELEPAVATSRPEHLPRPHPGSVFKRRVLDIVNLNRATVAEKIGISTKQLSRFVNGHAPVTIEFARKLEAATSISAAAWMNYQVAYDLYRTTKVHTDPEKILCSQS